MDQLKMLIMHYSFYCYINYNMKYSYFYPYNLMDSRLNQNGYHQMIAVVMILVDKLFLDRKDLPSAIRNNTGQQTPIERQIKKKKKY